jgi:hypothetical protein
VVEDHVIPSMPLRLHELVVLMRSLKVGLESDRINTEEKEIVRRLMVRIDRLRNGKALTGTSWLKCVAGTFGRLVPASSRFTAISSSSIA